MIPPCQLFCRTCWLLRRKLMKLNELSPPKGSKRSRKRVGRGVGSGKGKTAGRGTKGHNSRSGGGVRPGFEGGQMPIQRRLPKRGFRNVFRVEYQIVNLKDLARCGEEKLITPELLREKGIVRRNRIRIKILGGGTVAEGVVVKAHAFSATAKAKIESAKGSVEVI